MLKIAGQPVLTGIILTGISFEILVHIHLFGLALFVKFMILTCLFKNISASLLEAEVDIGPKRLETVQRGLFE